jgi:hypothetical protein
MTFEQSPTSEHLPHSLTIDYAGLSQEELNNISIFIGGSNAKVTPYTTELHVDGEIGGAILKWGDDNLDELLKKVTEESGYPYGAERLHVVALTENEAIWFLVIPKTPFDSETVIDDDGNEIPGLISLAIPEANSNNVFYSWDASGLEDIETSLLSGLSHRPWIDRDGYYLAMEISTRYRNTFDYLYVSEEYHHDPNESEM